LKQKRAKLTVAGLDSLQPRESRYEVYEGEGFGVRVYPAGRKTFLMAYHAPAAPGQTDRAPVRKVLIGDYGERPPALSLKQARGRFDELRVMLRQGIDPALARREERRQLAEAPTVEKLVDEYLEKHAKRKKRSWATDESYLRRFVVPAWGDMLAQEVTRRMVIDLLDRIATETPTTANRVLAVVRKMFNFALSRDMVPHSPCHQVDAPADETQKDRVLSGDEIKTLWHALGNTRPPKESYEKGKWTPMSEGSAIALKLQLATAQRIGEVTGMPWSEVDLAGGWWTIAGERSKNGLPHRVPLSKLARTLLERARVLGKDSAYVFPARTREGRPDAPIPYGVVDYALRRTREQLELAPFTPHDLRRTAASCMTGAGVPRLVVQKILNHAERGITAVYDRHSYDQEKRKALELWARTLVKLVEKG